MKVETMIEKCLNTARKLRANYIGRSEETDREYALAYKRCFEGSSEEVTRRLAAWDSVHNTTRENYVKGGLLTCI